MTKEDIVEKIKQSDNRPSIMVDKKGCLRPIVIKEFDETNGRIKFYEFNHLTIDFQEWIEKQRDKAALESISVNDIFSYYSSDNLDELIKNLAIYQKKNIEEDEAIAKAVKVNCDEMSIFVTKDKAN